MTATWVDGGYVNGTAEQTYAAGLLAVQAPWGYALSLAIGGLWFAPIMRRQGFLTLLDPFEQRFGRRAAALLYIPALTGEVFWTAAILTALGTTFGIILDLDFAWSIVLSAAIVILVYAPRRALVGGDHRRRPTRRARGRLVAGRAVRRRIPSAASGTRSRSIGRGWPRRRRP